MNVSEGRPSATSARTELAERRWLSWGRSVLAVVVVGVLIGLGIANIQLRAHSHEVEDGVLWSARAEGVVAAEIAPGSAAATAGIQRGDVLLAVNGSPGRTRGDTVEFAD